MGDFQFVWDGFAYSPAKRAALTGGPRHVTIPFLDDTAPDTFFLARGDTLVVDASPAAVSSGATSPAALRFYMDKGVRAFSRQGLQATVIATARMGVIISTVSRFTMVYDSEWMQQPRRPVLITSEPETVKELHKLVEDEIWHAEVISYGLLAELDRIWATRGSPGVREGILTSRNGWSVFLPNPQASVFFDQSIPADELRCPDEGNQSPAETGEAEPLYYTEGLELRADDPGLPVDSVLVDFDRMEGVQPPMVVASPPMPLPDSEGHRFQVLRGCRDCDFPYAWGEILAFTRIDELTVYTIQQTDVVLEIKHSARPDFLREFFDLWAMQVAPAVDVEPVLPNPEVASAFEERPLGTRSRFAFVK